MKISPLRLGALCLVIAAFVLGFAHGTAHAFGITYQRAQKSVYIQINVTPSPIAFRPSERPRSGGYAFQLGTSRSSLVTERWVADSDPIVVAQAQAQGAVPVQANVTPDPTASLLHTNTPAITLSGTAGTTVRAACAFTVTVGATTSWTLYSGLSSDFAGTTFPGNDLAFNMYVTSPPSPETYTAFVVYPDNNNNWAVVENTSTPQTYCVDLQLVIPGAVPGGQYSSNAVYTLFF